MDQVISIIGEYSCSAFYAIGADSIANAMECYVPTNIASIGLKADFVSQGWIIIIGTFFLLSGGGFFFFSSNEE